MQNSTSAGDEEWIQAMVTINTALGDPRPEKQDVIKALGVDPTKPDELTPAAIQRRFRHLLGLLHPDRQRKSAAANAAYIVLNACRTEMFQTNSEKAVVELIKAKVDLYYRNTPSAKCLVPQQQPSARQPHPHPPIYLSQMFNGCTPKPKLGHSKFGTVFVSPMPFVRMPTRPPTQSPPPPPPPSRPVYKQVPQPQQPKTTPQGGSRGRTAHPKPKKPTWVFTVW